MANELAVKLEEFKAMLADLIEFYEDSPDTELINVFVDAEKVEDYPSPEELKEEIVILSKYVERYAKKLADITNFMVQNLADK